MILLLTDPQPYDYQSYFEMNQDHGFQKEFLNLRSQTSESAKKALDSIINPEPGQSWSDFAFVKLASQASPTDRYDSSNSKTIGFISLNEAGLTDYTRSGFKMLLNFGVAAQYSGKGLMTHALNMRLEKYLGIGLNLVPAYIKGENPASEKVLRKCGFIRVNDDIFGSTYVRNISINETEFKKTFQEV